eukprot:4953957-Pyramimonas_sp.AAC.1
MRWWSGNVIGFEPLLGRRGGVRDGSSPPERSRHGAAAGEHPLLEPRRASDTFRLETQTSDVLFLVVY